MSEGSLRIRCDRVGPRALHIVVKAQLDTIMSLGSSVSKNQEALCAKLLQFLQSRFTQLEQRVLANEEIALRAEERASKAENEIGRLHARIEQLEKKARDDRLSWDTCPGSLVLVLFAF